MSSTAVTVNVRALFQLPEVPEVKVKELCERVRSAPAFVVIATMTVSVGSDRSTTGMSRVVPSTIVKEVDDETLRPFVSSSVRVTEIVLVPMLPYVLSVLEMLLLTDTVRVSTRLAPIR